MGPGLRAGYVAAREFGGGELVDPRRWAVGSIREVYEQYPHMKEVLPAMGYGKRQDGGNLSR